jgi:peptidyl-prolyl cis-trans isomerase SurA
MTDPDSRQEVFAIVKLVDKIESHKANLQNDYQQLAELFLQKKRRANWRNGLPTSNSKPTSG